MAEDGKGDLKLAMEGVSGRNLSRCRRFQLMRRFDLSDDLISGAVTRRRNRICG